MAILPARPFARPRTVRSLVTISALVATVAIAPVVADAAPHAAPHAKPTPAQVQKKLGSLAVKNTALVEQFNQARITTNKAKQAATAAQKHAAAVAQSYTATRSDYVKLVQSQYEGGSLGAAGALLESSSDADYMQRVSSMGMVSTHVSQVVTRIDTARTAAASAATKAKSTYVAAKKASDALVTERKQVATQIDKYRTLLQKLNSQQRAAYLRSQNPSVDLSNIHPTKATTKGAQRAVQFAIDQVGKPYVFGASGPGSYDCSGLTMAAWQHGGVSLPHSAADQYNYGKHVSLDNLSPGDLIFMYQPIEHVTIYIGDGMMASAPTEGQDVTVIPVNSYSRDIVGATHIG